MLPVQIFPLLYIISFKSIAILVTVLEKSIWELACDDITWKEKLLFDQVKMLESFGCVS